MLWSMRYCSIWPQTYHSTIRCTIHQMRTKDSHRATNSQATLNRVDQSNSKSQDEAGCCLLAIIVLTCILIVSFVSNWTELKKKCRNGVFLLPVVDQDLPCNNLCLAFVWQVTHGSPRFSISCWLTLYVINCYDLDRALKNIYWKSVVTCGQLLIYSSS